MGMWITPVTSKSTHLDYNARVIRDHAESLEEQVLGIVLGTQPKLATIEDNLVGQDLPELLQACVVPALTSVRSLEGCTEKSEKLII